MKNNPAYIKLLAQRMSAHPEWTGPNGIFFNPYSGYAGVKIFAGYVKHLKLVNSNRVPHMLRRKAKDYLYYLNELPEDKKTQYASYFQRTVPKIYNMIRLGKMTKESILEFVNIFHELGIGSNPLTIVADYQLAISEAFKFQEPSSEEKSKSQDQEKSQSQSQNEAYRPLSLSDSEKAGVIENCRQQGLIVSADQLDNYYVGSSGNIYSGDGKALTNQALLNALSKTLQYQVGAGNAEKLPLKSLEIANILEECGRKGLNVTKEDLENIYMDKDGQLYFGDGSMVTNVDLGTAIKQTPTYAEAYEKFAGKRGAMPVAQVARDDREEPKKVNPQEIAKLSRVPEGSTERPISSYTDRARGGLVLPTGEVMPLTRDSLEGMSLSGGVGMPMKMPHGWHFGRGVEGNTRQKAKGNKAAGKERMSQDGSGQQAGNPSDQQDPAQQQQPQRRAPETDTADTSAPKNEEKGLAGTIGKGIAGLGAGYGFAKLTGISITAATFFIPTNVIDTHYFVSTILKIIFK